PIRASGTRRSGLKHTKARPRLIVERVELRDLIHKLLLGLLIEDAARLKRGTGTGKPVLEILLIETGHAVGRLKPEAKTGKPGRIHLTRRRKLVLDIAIPLVGQRLSPQPAKLGSKHTSVCAGAIPARTAHEAVDLGAGLVKLVLQSLFKVGIVLSGRNLGKVLLCV